MSNRRTLYPGVRYKEHPTKRRGLKPLRYFSIYYRVMDKDGQSKVVEEGLGWELEKPQKDENGHDVGWTEKKAIKALLDLKERQKLAKDAPKTYRDERKVQKAKEESDRNKEEQKKRSRISFDEMFNVHYLPVARNDKSERSCNSEESKYRIWAKRIIGLLPLEEITIEHLETIKNGMKNKKQAAASIRYMLAMVRQVFNYAIKNRGYKIDNPVTRVKKPKADNKRMRFLTHVEADMLLSTLRDISPAVHDMVLLSLNCGLRASEIFNLTWGDVDTKNGTLFLRDTKSGHNRHSYMTDSVKAMFLSMPRGKSNDLVFPGRKGRKHSGQTRIVTISKTFDKTVKKLGFNENVTDPRLKVVFHTCRHTYASWLVQNGVDLYRVQKLLGHQSITQTERYSHLAEGDLQEAVRTLERAPANKDNVVELRR